MKQPRDMTKNQFEAAMKRHGFKPEGFMGYWQLPKCGVCISVLNAGNRRRDQLAYMLSQKDAHLKGETGASRSG